MKEIFHCGPDDPRITQMDPVQKIWMYHNWIADQLDTAELAKNHAYLLASFTYPEEVKKMLGEGDVHVSTEEEFDESTRMVREANLKLLEVHQERNRKTRRKRKLKLDNLPTAER